jgi:hypothetical protein
LLVVSSEVDSRDDNIRSSISIYQYGFESPSYPTIESQNRADGSPIAWAALSGLAAEIRGPPKGEFKGKKASGKGKKASGEGKKASGEGKKGSGEGKKGSGEGKKGSGKGKKGSGPSRRELKDEEARIMYAVEDSYYKKSRIFTIDASSFPAKLTKEVRVKDTKNLLKNSPPFGSDLVNDDATVNLDMEGIAVSKNGGFWVCSEGAGTVGDASFPVTSLNYLIKVDASGVIDEVVLLPDEVNDLQVHFGFAGCAEGSGAFADKVVVAFQRAWNGESSPRLGAFDQVTKQWSFYYYPLDAVESQNGGWVGLGDIAPLGIGGEFLVLERDNMAGPDAVVKRVYKIDLGKHNPGETVTKKLFVDIYPALADEGGLVVEKVEGLTVDRSGDVWVVNDNDGLDSNSGETLLLNVMSSRYNHGSKQKEGYAWYFEE